MSSAVVTGKDKMYQSHPARDVMGLIQAEAQRKKGGWENYLGDRTGRTGLREGQELEGPSGFSFGS